MVHTRVLSQFLVLLSILTHFSDWPGDGVMAGSGRQRTARNSDELLKIVTIVKNTGVCMYIEIYI